MAYPLCAQKRERIEQHVDALEHPQFADEHDIGGVRFRRYRRQLRLGDAIVHDLHDASRHADALLESIAAVGALEQEQFRARHQHALERQVDQAER